MFSMSEELSFGVFHVEFKSQLGFGGRCLFG
jgi:hypothetical protein